MKEERNDVIINRLSMRAEVFDKDDLTIKREELENIEETRRRKSVLVFEAAG